MFSRVVGVSVSCSDSVGQTETRHIGGDIQGHGTMQMNAVHHIKLLAIYCTILDMTAKQSPCHHSLSWPAECRVVGSCVGGRAQMREMFQVASLHNIKPIVDKMPLEKCNEAVDKLMAGDARYRYFP